MKKVIIIRSIGAEVELSIENPGVKVKRGKGALIEVEAKIVVNDVAEVEIVIDVAEIGIDVVVVVEDDEFVGAENVDVDCKYSVRCSSEKALSS